MGKKTGKNGTARTQRYNEKMKKSATVNTQRYNEKMKELGLTKIGMFVPERDAEDILQHGRELRQAYLDEIGHQPYLRDEIQREILKTGT